MGRNPGWIETHSGRWVDIMCPKPEQICIEDIAFSLADMPRFGGHARHSVADHSETVRLLCELDGAGRYVQLLGLLHDAHEAYLLDVPRPLKLLPQMAWYRAACERMQAVIHEALGVPPAEPGALALIKTMDWMALLFEAEELLPSRGECWRDDEPGILLRSGDFRRKVAWRTQRIWYQAGSERMFLKRYRELVQR